MPRVGILFIEQLFAAGEIMRKWGRWGVSGAVSVVWCLALAACGNGSNDAGQAHTAAKLLAQAETSGIAWRQCALEDQSCDFAGTRAVRYGANGSYTVKTVTGPAQCGNATFGDPAPGVDKFCSLALETPLPTAWSPCAAEEATCTVTGTRLVRYGADGRFVYRNATGAVRCSNAVFDDPLPGVDKACSVADDGTPADPWIACAAEDQQCAFSGLRRVRYGANGSFAYRTATGPVQCGNAVFGDPLPGVDKSCSYFATLAQPAGDWTIVDIGTLGGDETSVAALNDGGSVVGWSRLAGGAQRAFVYRDGRMSNLGVLAGDDSSAAVAINNGGEIVGSSAKAGDAASARTFSSDGGGLNEVVLPFAAVKQVQDINDAGDILVYYYGTSHGGCTSPVTGCNYVARKAAAPIDLQGTLSKGLKINNGGVIMAFSGNSRESTLLYNVHDASVARIASVPGGPAYPYSMASVDINNAAEVVGNSGYGRPYVYRQGVVADIAAVINGDVTSLAGINDHGDIVGTMQAGGGGTVFFWQASTGSLVDLNTVAGVRDAGWRLQNVKAVNNAGQIIGQGINGSGQQRAFLLTPR
jgi:probable HAF family extracellular repeat protein